MPEHWGEQLRTFRTKAGYETLSQFAAALEEADLPYLDVTTLSRYENNPQRIPRQRDRHLRLLKVLVAKGGIANAEEANAWLSAGQMGHLTPQEQQALFPEKEQEEVVESPPETPTAVSPLPPPSDPPPPNPVSHRPAWATGLFALFAIILLGGFLLQTRLLTQSQTVAPPIQPAAPQSRVIQATANLLDNGSFEADQPTPWRAAHDCPLVTFAPHASRPQAYLGEQYLLAAADNKKCYSFYQDIPLTGQVTGDYTFHLRARSADGSPRHVTLALWTGGMENDAFVWNELDNQTKQFLIGGNEWRCLETSLTITRDWQRNLRAEIYLDTLDGVIYHFDDAWLQAGDSGVCPAPPTTLQNGGFESASLFPWISAEGCQVATMQRSAAALEGRQMATAVSQGNPCRSFFQDIFNVPHVGDTYTFSVWAKSANAAPLTGELVLWAEGGIQEKAATPFLIYGPDWRCLQVQLPINQAGHDRIRAELFLGTTDGSTYYFDDANVQLRADAVCLPQPIRLENPSFDNETLFPWQDFNCGLLKIGADSLAHDGRQHLIAQQLGACNSFYQDIPLLMSPGDVYRYSIWVRSSDDTPRQGEIVLWADGGQKEKAGKPFIVSGSEWQCVETELVIAQENHTLLRAEVYLSQPDVEYLFDKAALSAGGVSNCPLVDLFLGNLSIVDTGPFYAGSAVSVAAEVRNGGATAVHPGITSIWVATEPNGNPIDPARQKMITLPETIMPQASKTIAADVSIPLGLEPGEYHLVFEADSGQNLLETNEQNNRYSLPLTISPCATGTLFCDVPLEHWARAEMETWYQLGMTRGCHSEGVAYENLPFCPNSRLDRATFAVFLLRHLQGATYRPDAAYEGRFADVTPDTSFAVWIEELARQNIALDSDLCPQNGGAPQFCPFAPLTKGDLARYLAQVLAWPVPEEADGHFVDVNGRSLEARAITYMAQQGYLAYESPFCATATGRAFCAEQGLTRAETAVMMVRAFGLVQSDP